MADLTMSAMSGSIDRNALLLFYATSTPGDHCTIAYGDPGGGKTTVGAAVARVLGAADDHVVRWSAPQMDVPDYNGYATPRADGLHFECSADIRRVCDGQPAMFIVDEIGNADRSIQGAMLKPLDSRTIGEQKIPESCRMVGFLNPPETTTDMQDLAFALMNRAVWFPWERVTDDEHVAYMRARRDTRTSIRLPEWCGTEAWWKAYDEVCAIYATYKLKLHEGMLWEDPRADEVKVRWPMCAASPRSWDLFLRLCATCRVYGDTVAMRTFGKGTIGEPQTNVWLNFYTTQDLMGGEELVADVHGPRTWKPDPRRTDQTFAQLGIVGSWATNGTGLSDKALLKRWHDGWDVVRYVLECGEGEDVALLCAQDLFTKMPKGGLLQGYEDVVNRFRALTVATSLFDDANAVAKE